MSGVKARVKYASGKYYETYTALSSLDVVSLICIFVNCICLVCIVVILCVFVILCVYCCATLSCRTAG
jgi:hypothetical protein